MFNDPTEAHGDEALVAGTGFHRDQPEVTAVGQTAGLTVRVGARSVAPGVGVTVSHVPVAAGVTAFAATVKCTAAQYWTVTRLRLTGGRPFCPKVSSRGTARSVE